MQRIRAIPNLNYIFTYCDEKYRRIELINTETASSCGSWGPFLLYSFRYWPHQRLHHSSELSAVRFQSPRQSCVLNIDLVTSAHDPWPVMLTPCPGGWGPYISQPAVSIDYLPGTCSEKWSQGECLSWEPYRLSRQQGLASALHLNRLWVVLVNQSP